MTGSLHRIALLYPSVFLFRQLLLLSPDPPLPLALLYHLKEVLLPLCLRNRRLLQTPAVPSGSPDSRLPSARALQALCRPPTALPLL